MTDCIHAKNNKPFTPCELYGLKPCRPEGCKHREPVTKNDEKVKEEETT